MAAASKIPLTLLLVAAIGFSSAGAAAGATIYLRDKGTIKGLIVSETADAFMIKAEGVNYSPTYKHDTIKKVDIYAVIDDKGRLRWPDDLLLRADIETATSQEEFQKRLLTAQLRAHEETARSVKSISKLLWLQFGLSMMGAAVYLMSQ